MKIKIVISTITTLILLVTTFTNILLAQNKTNIPKVNTAMENSINSNSGNSSNRKQHTEGKGDPVTIDMGKGFDINSINLDDIETFIEKKEGFDSKIIEVLVKGVNYECIQRENILICKPKGISQAGYNIICDPENLNSFCYQQKITILEMAENE